ncbi:hypothetical protein ACI0FR_00171 [Paenochrobactrum sp. BZR 201-1]
MMGFSLKLGCFISVRLNKIDQQEKISPWGERGYALIDLFRLSPPPPPSSIEPCLIVLALFLAVMAGLAKALQVSLIPEHAFIAAMYLDVVANKLRRVWFNALAHLAGEQITREYHQA